MTRILGIIIVGLLALSIGLGAALWHTRTHAANTIYTLQDEIHARTQYGGGNGPRPGDGFKGDRDKGDKSDGRGNGRGPGQFKQVQERLNLTPAQVRDFREFLRARRDIRRSVLAEIASREAAFRSALSGDKADTEKLLTLRAQILERNAAANEEAFTRFVELIDTLSPEQREAMLEMTGGNPNSLLFL
jgi:Spy/CpxP family protein refolding chaperone